MFFSYTDVTSLSDDPSYYYYTLHATATATGMYGIPKNSMRSLMRKLAEKNGAQNSKWPSPWPPKW